MSISNDGWVRWAVKRPGPANKQYSQRNAMLGFACHSVEGWLAGAFGELDNPQRQASWCFTNARDGTLYQHYPIWASTWCSGNLKANTELIGVESEGLAGTPLNEAQVANMLQLMREWEALTGRVAKRSQPGRTVWEHNEVAQWATPNAGPTACPSHRYDPFFEALEVDDMPDPRVDKLIAALGGEQAIDAWNANGNSLIAGYTLEQRKLAEHLGNHPNVDVSTSTTVVPEHTHQPGQVAR